MERYGICHFPVGETRRARRGNDWRALFVIRSRLKQTIAPTTDAAPRPTRLERIGSSLSPLLSIYIGPLGGSVGAGSWIQLLPSVAGWIWLDSIPSPRWCDCVHSCPITGHLRDETITGRMHTNKLKAGKRKGKKARLGKANTRNRRCWPSLHMAIQLVAHPTLPQQLLVRVRATQGNN